MENRSKLRPYESLDLSRPFEHYVLRKVAKELTFPLSPEDLRDIETIEFQFDNEENMAGLAAPQIGISKQIIVFAAPEDPALKKWRPDFTQSMPKTVWINPTYRALSESKHEDYEACFSVLNMAGPVKRFKSISYVAYDKSGILIEGKAEGFLARVIQHEIDHLQGKLFLDYVEEGRIINQNQYKEKRNQALKNEK